MSASLESRVPFLDHHLVEFVCRLPPQFKLKGFQTKRILREALGDLVPPIIVTRSKLGFPTPTREWFRGPYFSTMERLLTAPDAMIAEYVRPAYTREVLNRHRSNQWNLEEQIWTLGNLELWLRIFIRGDQPESNFWDS